MICKRPDLSPSTAYSHYHCKCDRCVLYNRQRNRNAILVTRRRRLKNTYGISWERYQDMLLTQGRRCRICERFREEFKRDFSVDHNHKTGQIRGLLCGNCNTALGKLKDDVNLLKRATEYVNKNGDIR